MPRNGSGTYNLPAGNPVVSGTVIASSGWANPTLTDIASALTNSIAADGQTTPSANLPMGGFAHTNVGAATARTQYARAAEVQDGAIDWLTSVAGTNAITATAPLGMSAYVAGQTFRFVAAGTNTGAVTIVINGIPTPRAITKNGTTALAGGEIVTGGVYQITFDGTRFQLSAPPVTLIASGSASAVADIQFLSLSAAYEAYQLVLHDLLPATAGADLHVQISNNNGATWFSGASDYKHVRTGTSVTFAPGGSGANADTKIVIANAMGNSAVIGNELRGVLFIHAPMDPNDQTSVTHQVAYTPNITGNYTHYVGNGARTGSGADNAFRLIMSSGNITTCTYALYGLRNT